MPLNPNTEVMQAAFGVLAGNWESATYTPKNGTPKTINVIPLRGRLMPRDGERVEYTLSVFFSRADVSNVNIGGDKITLNTRSSSPAATTYTVSTIIDDDAGFWHVGVN